LAESEIDNASQSILNSVHLVESRTLPAMDEWRAPPKSAKPGLLLIKMDDAMRSKMKRTIEWTTTGVIHLSPSTTKDAPT